MNIGCSKTNCVRSCVWVWGCVVVWGGEEGGIMMNFRHSFKRTGCNCLTNFTIYDRYAEYADRIEAKEGTRARRALLKPILGLSQMPLLRHRL